MNVGPCISAPPSPATIASATARVQSVAASVGELLARHRDELAAVVAEPVVQGAGGMRFHSPACVRFLRELCDEHDLPLVLDEIATGFGRTGALFACEHAGIAPDVMCVGKSLTGGYMTLAATLCTRAVADAIVAGEGGALMHGPTFMANPLASATAQASLDVLAGGGWRAPPRACPGAAGCGAAAPAQPPRVRTPPHGRPRPRPRSLSPGRARR